MLCYRYDLVLNGFEIGGGSIRLHDPEVQAQVFQRARHRGRGGAARSSASCSTRSASARRRTAASRSAWTAWRCCSPGAESLRDVIPFPKTQKGTDLMTDAPEPGDPRAARRAQNSRQ